MNSSGITQPQLRNVSPVPMRSYTSVVSPQQIQRITITPQSSIVKQYQQQPMQQMQHSFSIQATPPRNPNVPSFTTPSTAQTYITTSNPTIVTQGPSRFNVALDQVCLLGHEMEQMRKNFELVQIELQQWKEKCALIKVIASTPPPGINYSPTRTNKLHSEVHTSFQNYQLEINKLNQIISIVNNDLVNSVDRIKQLEKKVGEMNKVEYEMQQAKRTAQELDNMNRFQALELNELKHKVDTSNQQSEDLNKIVQNIPHLKESVHVLEEENKKLITIVQNKDDLLEKQEKKHIQLTKMYQDNLEQTNLISQQLREALNENEEIDAEVERTHNIADSANALNMQNSVYLSKGMQNNNQQQPLNKLRTQIDEGSFDPNNIRGSGLRETGNLKKSTSSTTQNRNLRNSQRLNAVQNTIVDQQGSLEVLQKLIKDQETRISQGEKDKAQLTNKLEESISEINRLMSESQRERQESDANLRRAQDEFADQISGSVVPLQKENEAMQQEINNLRQKFQNLKLSLSQLEQDKQALLDQINNERQESFNNQQNLINEFELKFDALNTNAIQKDSQLDHEILKNKELFEDNKLMAEEMRLLKQKAIELDSWKHKYRELKRETKALKLSFEEYKQAFIREIQDRFANGCGQFEQCLQYIDERFDSSRGQLSLNQEELQRHNVTSSQVSSSTNKRQLSPTQERLRQMKATPSKCSALTTVSKIESRPPHQSNIQSNITAPTNGGSEIQPQQTVTQQYSSTQPVYSHQQPSNVSGFVSTSNRQPIGESHGKYAKEIMQTNDELDSKLEELVILKAKYEDALNRVHTNISNATPKKQNY